jgi:osmotically-inducible protein OsmY
VSGGTSTQTVGEKAEAASKKFGDRVENVGKEIGDKASNIGESIDDASITALVKATLLYHRSTSAIKTKVETVDGVVTLTGTAKNASEKELASKFVQDVSGVKSVVNKMNVEIVKTT